jgi:hypothetical protein
MSVTAPDADRCADSSWALSGPVTRYHATPAPAGCFTAAHAYDTRWFNGADLPPGSYSVSLTVTRNGLSSTTSRTFDIAA